MNHKALAIAPIVAIASLAVILFVGANIGLIANVSGKQIPGPPGPAANAVTGNVLLDAIILSILTGGGVISLVSLFLDRLSKKRADYVATSNDKIKRFSETQLYYVQLGSYYGGLSSLLKVDSAKKEVIEYDICMWFICNILYLVSKFTSEKGMVQFDNAYVEEVILDLMTTIHSKLQDPKFVNKLNYAEMSRLKALIGKEFTYESFLTDQSTEKNKLNKWLRELEKTDELLDLQRKSMLFSILIYVELTFIYEIDYGRRHLQEYYQYKHILDKDLDKDLLTYLKRRHTPYHNRLSKLKLIKN